MENVITVHVAGPAHRQYKEIPPNLRLEHYVTHANAPLFFLHYWLLKFLFCIEIHTYPSIRVLSNILMIFLLGFLFAQFEYHFIKWPPIEPGNTLIDLDGFFILTLGEEECRGLWQEEDCKE